MGTSLRGRGHPRPHQPHQPQHPAPFFPRNLRDGISPARLEAAKTPPSPILSMPLCSRNTASLTSNPAPTPATTGARSRSRPSASPTPAAPTARSPITSCRRCVKESIPDQAFVAQRARAFLSRQHPGGRGVREAHRHVRRRPAGTVAGAAFARRERAESAQPAAYLPKSGYVKNTAKYVMGPVGLEKISAPLSAQLVDFNASAEVALGTYQTSDGAGHADADRLSDAATGRGTSAQDRRRQPGRWIDATRKSDRDLHGPSLRQAHRSRSWWSPPAQSRRAKRGAF